MWTRTLSTTISTGASSGIAGLAHGRRRGRPARAATDGEDEARDERSRDEPADMREERHAAVRLHHPDRGEPVDELEHEPESEHDRRRDVDQLIEETEEHQRRDARPGEEHDVCPE